MSRWELLHADCRGAMRAMDADSIDAIVTDPPYGLGFMGKGWDDFARQREYQARGDEGYGDRGVLPGYGRGGTSEQREKFRRRSNVSFYEFSLAWAKEALRVAKPGAHIVAFGGTRTFHRLTCAIEDAGWEVRDCLSWLYGSGFPKSLDVSKAIDKAAGAEREVVGRNEKSRTRKLGAYNFGGRDVINGSNKMGQEFNITAPATDAARQWQGWGTALKPAWEPIILARKPLVGTVASNVLAHGTGALNIDGCRIGGGVERKIDNYPSKGPQGSISHGVGKGHAGDEYTTKTVTCGRWPANVALDEEAAVMLDAQSGDLGVSSGGLRGAGGRHGRFGHIGAMPDVKPGFGDSGGASRFFYTAKASRRERGEGNTHPTVKPQALMRWLVRMVTPPGGLVLDPFNGSGSTGVASIAEGFRYVGCEREAEYVEISRRRLSDAEESQRSLF